MPIAADEQQPTPTFLTCVGYTSAVYTYPTDVAAVDANMPTYEAILIVISLPISRPANLNVKFQ